MPTGVVSGTVDVALVTPGYFRTMETPLYQGRDFLYEVVKIYANAK